MKNKDQIKGAAKGLAGKIENRTGRVLGDKSMEAKGSLLEVRGKIQERVGDLKQINRIATKR